MQLPKIVTIAATENQSKDFSLNSRKTGMEITTTKNNKLINVFQNAIT